MTCLSIEYGLRLAHTGGYIVLLYWRQLQPVQVEMSRLGSALMRMTATALRCLELLLVHPSHGAQRVGSTLMEVVGGPPLPRRAALVS